MGPLSGLAHAQWCHDSLMATPSLSLSAGSQSPHCLLCFAVRQGVSPALDHQRHWVRAYFHCNPWACSRQIPKGTSPCRQGNPGTPEPSTRSYAEGLLVGTVLLSVQMPWGSTSLSGRSPLLIHPEWLRTPDAISPFSSTLPHRS
jgi:hypothetical protein